jgi:hypothetical protein
MQVCGEIIGSLPYFFLPFPPDFGFAALLFADEAAGFFAVFA